MTYLSQNLVGTRVLHVCILVSPLGIMVLLWPDQLILQCCLLSIVSMLDIINMIWYKLGLKLNILWMMTWSFT